jgi:hypothetical protein
VHVTKRPRTGTAGGRARYAFVTISRSYPTARPPRRRTTGRGPARGPDRQRVGKAVALGILGAAIWLGLGLAGPAAAPETGPDLLAQALWREPRPSFLAPGPVVREAPAVGRSLLPTDPPRALGVPAVTRRESNAAPAPRGTPIRVYFSHRPDSESSPPSVFPVSRVAADRAVATAALAALIEGPNDAERAAGYYSELGGALAGPSTCSGRDFGIAIADGTATVRVCRAVTSAGVGRDTMMRSQIEATLRQFPTIRTVRLLGNDGGCLLGRSEGDGCVGRVALR